MRLYDQCNVVITPSKVLLQPKDISAFCANYKVGQQPTGQQSKKKGRLTRKFMHTQCSIYRTVSFSYRVIQTMALDYLD